MDKNYSGSPSHSCVVLPWKPSICHSLPGNIYCSHRPQRDDDDDDDDESGDYDDDVDDGVIKIMTT